MQQDECLSVLWAFGVVNGYGAGTENFFLKSCDAGFSYSHFGH